MNGYDLVRSQPSHDEMAKKVKDFLDNGGTVGGAIKGVTGTTGHRFLEHTGVFNGRNALLRTSTANTNGYPAIINMIEDKDTPDNGNGFVFTLGNGKSGDQYRNSFLRPISKAFGSGSLNLGSPSTPWDDLWLGTYSKSGNGYTKLPNGLVLQWGISSGSIITSAANTDVKITFPVLFNTKPLAIIPVFGAYYIDGAWESMVNIGSTVRADIWDTKGFQVRYNRRDGGTRPAKYQLHWYAIGY